MATFKPYPTGNVFGVSDWLEAMAQVKPGGSDVFSNTSADVVVVVDMPGRGKILTQGYLQSAQALILGYAWADDASPWKLHRSPAISHPLWGPQYRASAVSFDLYEPSGNTNNPNNNPYDLSTFSGIGFDISRFGKYLRAKMTVKFGLRPYPLYLDTAPQWNGLETGRYFTKYDITSEVELLEANDRSLIWIEGNPASAGGCLNKAYPGSFTARVSKCGLVGTWWEVPESFICDSTGIPKKILRCVGCVNSQTFLGHLPYTLLFEPPTFEKWSFPFYSYDGVAYNYNIKFSFKQFNPEKGVVDFAHGGVQITNDRGWRLFPFRGGSPTSGVKTGGFGWFGARRSDSAPTNPPTYTATSASPTVVEEIDFNTAFTHVGAP